LPETFRDRGTSPRSRGCRAASRGKLELGTPTVVLVADALQRHFPEDEWISAMYPPGNRTTAAWRPSEA
jgi:hypothetical protein